MPPSCDGWWASRDPESSLPRMMRDPDDPILDEPWTWRLAALHWERTGEGDAIELTLHREGHTRRFRFDGVQDLELRPGFAGAGLMFLYERLPSQQEPGVRVTTLDEPPATIDFRARSVRELPATG